MSRSLPRVAAVVVSSWILAGCAAAGGGRTTATSAVPVPSAAATASASASIGASGDLLADLDIGDGRTMHLLCVGAARPGQPTVVFESGLGGDAGQWSDVIHELAGDARACAYDRAGVGQSPPARVGRTTIDQVADLRALLAAAAIEPPYLLVGYSVGGWNVLVHEDAHPDEVIGAVLVDVRPPTASERWKAALPAETPGESEAIHLTRMDPVTFEQDATQNPEGLLLADSAAQAQATAGFGDDPLIVLAAGDERAVTEGFDVELGATMARIWWELQADLASRSTVGRLDKVEGTTHELPFERPDAIADAIREVLGS